ncbi:MAG: S8 family serine peptidase [Fibrobacteres bacterium]|nr:S8 family serine peptidase [Fibrobacterota bacterium]
MALALLAGSARAQPLDGPIITRNFPYALPGKEIHVWKHWDAKEGSYRLGSNSDLVRSSSDLVALETAEWESRKRKWGALGEALQSKLSRMGDTGSVDVVVSMKYPEGVVYFDKTRESGESMREQSLQVAALAPVADVEVFLAKVGLGNKGRISKESAVANLTKSQLMKLMFADEVASIEPYFPGRPTGTPAQFSTLAASAYNHSSAAVPSGAGAGVNAATLEAGLNGDFLSCLGITPSNIVDVNPGASEHSMATWECLRYAAPGAKLGNKNLAGNFLYNAPGNQDWIINNGIQTLSLSYSNSGTPTKADMLFVDDFAYQWPFPVFCNPTGNGLLHDDGSGMAPDYQCYNAISVGNVRHVNQTYFDLSATSNPDGACTQTKNPPPRWGNCISGSGSDCAGDREMPYLVAPGHSPTNIVSTVQGREGQLFLDQCDSYDWFELKFCGTSWSAPVVNGIAADVIAADSRLINWPEKVRAVLMATAQNVTGGYWSSQVDGKDGAGVVYGSAAVNFASSHSTTYPNSAPIQYGIGSGSLYASDFSTPDIIYKIGIPSSKPAGKHLRVVLTWDSNPVLGGDNALSDLDLKVNYGTSSKSSLSNDGNVEMVDIASNLIPAGSTMDAHIIKWSNRIPSGSRTNFFYYAIAWTWVEDHAP